MNVRNWHKKTLLCDAKGCDSVVNLEGQDPIADASIVTSARDQKWRLVNSKWLCEDCYNRLRDAMADVGLRVDDAGKIVERTK